MNLVSIGSDNGLSHQAITWINADLLSIRPWWNVREIRIKITKHFTHENAFQIVICQMTAILSRGGDELE